MSRPVHFEMHAADPHAVMDFYSKTFGWTFQQFEGDVTGYWLAKTGDDQTPGINGAIMQSRDGNPRTVNTLMVESIDDAVKAVQANGGQVVVEKFDIPNVGAVAYCTDPGGNIFGVFTRSHG